MNLRTTEQDKPLLGFRLIMGRNELPYRKTRCFSLARKLANPYYLLLMNEI